MHVYDRTPISVHSCYVLSPEKKEEIENILQLCTHLRKPRDVDVRGHGKSCLPPAISVVHLLCSVLFPRSLFSYINQQVQRVESEFEKTFTSEEMFSYITLLAVALQAAAVWGCECAGPTLPANDFGLDGGAHGGLIPSSGLIGAYPDASGLTGDASGIYPGSAGIVSDAAGAYDDDADLHPAGAGLLPTGAAATGFYSSSCQPQCVSHRIEPVVRPVVDECLTNVPVIKKHIRHRTECVTRHVPVVDRLVSQQEEKYIRHVPVTQKLCRNVVELRTRHVPIVKSRTRTVVEPYTTHVPITEKYSRPVEESITKHVPIVERRCRPIVHHSTRLVPITEKRIRPIIESQCVNVPVRRRYVKNLVEQRVRAVTGPCPVCPPGTELNAAEPYPAGFAAGVEAGIYHSGLGALPSGLSLAGEVPTDIAAYAGLPAEQVLPAGPYSLDAVPAGAHPSADLGVYPASDLSAYGAPIGLPAPCGC